MYEDLAKCYVNDDEIIIARCDLDKQNVPAQVYHIPTIQLFPAKKKNAPVEYFSALTDLGKYKEFIREERDTKPR